MTTPAALRGRFPEPVQTGLALTAVLLVFACAQAAWAQADPDSARQRQSSWFAIPTLFYTPETSLGGGAAGGYFVDAEDRRPSSVQGNLFVTLKGQYALVLRPEWYRRGDRQRLFSDVELSSYPNVFYGIGPETTDEMEEELTSRYVDAVVQLEQNVSGALWLGLRSRFRHEVVTETEEDGLLAGTTVPGSDGTTVFGLGLVATWDGRDRLFYPTRGPYLNTYVVTHPEWLGTEFDFSRVVIDARRYVPLGGQHVLGLQAYGEAVSGTAPFTLLPLLGGSLRMRGYLEGRYRDNVFAAAQAEWRFPLGGRFDGALFASTGAVSPRIEEFATDGLEVAGGAGLRYRLNNEGVRIRLDYAFGLDGPGFYITAVEPF